MVVVAAIHMVPQKYKCQVAAAWAVEVGMAEQMQVVMQLPDSLVAEAEQQILELEVHQQVIVLL